LHVAIPHWTVVSVVGSRIGTSYYGSPTNGLLNPAATCPLTSEGQGRAAMGVDSELRSSRPHIND
jgi:hypothetical protein